MAFLIIAFYVFGFLWEQFLLHLDIKRMSPRIPPELGTIYNAEDYARQQAYQKASSRFSQFSAALSFTVVLLALSFGALGWLDDFLRGYTSHFLLLPLAFFGTLLVAGEIVHLPFRWYAVFTIEERFGFNNSTPGLFIADSLKNTLLGLVIGSILLTAVLYIYHYTGGWFWLLAWLFISGFSLLITFFYSEWIVPLFNKQTPLAAGELRTAIETFADKAGFRLDNIYVMDGSKRSTKANAYFTGFGKKKRIVLFDTLMNELGTTEIVAVLAHEIGHYKRRHIVKSMFISVASMGVMCALLSFFLDSPAIAKALGGEVASFHLGVIGFLLLFTPASEILHVVVNYISRKNEYEADGFAVRFGLGDALISGLKKISTKALINLNPHPLVVFCQYSHPTLSQRIFRIKEARAG